MQIAQIEYKGSLLIEATHLKSGTKIKTDAPIDNNGKGSSFSPTDLVSTALASCMITIMGIKAETWGKDLENCKAEIVKIMGSNPRKIAEIGVTIYCYSSNFDLKERQILENVAKNCPVALSLSTDLVQNIKFVWH